MDHNQKIKAIIGGTSLADRVRDLEDSFLEYLVACYTDPTTLPLKQYREIRLAYFSGIHMLNSKTVKSNLLQEALHHVIFTPGKEIES